MAKVQKIDLLKIMIEANNKKWNSWLLTCEINQDVNGLVKVLRGIQQGMDDLVKQKLNTDNVTILFLRLQRSIENTIKNIWRRQNDNPLYNPLFNGDINKYQKTKRNLDHELELFLKKERF